MRIRLGVSPDIDLDTMGAAIDAALEATTTAQVPLIQRGSVPDIRTAIGAGKIRWRPEPPGEEHFDDAVTVLKRGWGDCDDLAPWHAAGLRASGEDPEAKAFVYQSGPRRWHAVVQRSDGSVDDPSRWAGMRSRGGRVQGVGAAAWPPMWEGRLGLAAHPYSTGWAGRVDLPDSQWPLSWSATAIGPTPAHAVVGAIRGACRVADLVGIPHDIDIIRCAGIDSLLCGEDLSVVGGIMGDEVGIFPALAAAAPLVAPLAGKALGMLGLGSGGGSGGAPGPVPGAVMTPQGMMPGGMQAAPGTAFAVPGGPIIVRF